MTFGAAFVLNFVVIDALSDPGAGRLGRALHALFDTQTLGALTQKTHHPAAGYIAFFTLVLFLFVLSSLPGRTSRAESGRRLPSAATRELEGR